MSKANIVRIERLEVKKSDIDKVKKIFDVKDNAEAIREALDMASGKIELENIFQKFKGVKIKKVYA